jgi:glutamyl-Q tRNA(Asp) synthetase
MGLNGPIYPLTCYRQHRHKQGAIRFHTSDDEISFNDHNLGKISQVVARDSGDFVIKRNNGLYNYQLAVVIDDQFQGITEIVRGSDLLNLTPSQIDLQQGLAYATPQYLHLPVISNIDGQKLSKQTGAKPLDVRNAADNLWFCLDFLGQNPPHELKQYSLSEIWQWAVRSWNPQRIPKKLSLNHTL